MRVFLLAASALFSTGASAQVDKKQDTSGLSRMMRTAVMFYERGEDMQAMDRFMEILTKGDPAERPMANEYINLITHRMNTGNLDYKAPASKRPSPPIVEEDVSPRAPLEPAAAKSAAPRVSAPSAGIHAEPVFEPNASPPALVARADRGLMREEIQARIRASLDKSLEEIKAGGGAVVVSSEKGEPLAIGLPAALFFSAGVSFQKSAGRLLDSLTRLVYAVGKAKVLLLPEGALMGDAKVLDMRRAMGLSAHFFSMGVAPARVKVNLLNNQIEVPKALQAFKGIIILFVYGEPLGLTPEAIPGEEAGPPLSLGTFPAAFRPERNEGVIMEFSVMEPPGGLAGWKFQLLQPSAAGGAAVLLQEVTGSAPAFHQIYWNGRSNYSGPLLPGGRYECVLTATDGKNRQKTLRRWVELLAEKKIGPAPTPPLSPAPKPAAVKPPASDAVKPEPAAAAKVPKPARPQDAYELAFRKDTHRLGLEGEKKMPRLAELISYYPMDNLKLVGQAEPSETEAVALALRRAQMVAGLLVNRYQVESKKIQVDSRVVEGGGAKVDVYFIERE